jgi:membrane protein DedA with SNARE-associated domain
MLKLIHVLLQTLGYPQILLLMAMESTFLPIPSELVVPPAAYRAYLGELSLVMVVLFSTLGSLLGASFNYFLGKSLGRKVIYYLAGTRIARLLFINPEKIMHAEAYFNHYGKSATFLGRLVPGVRHLISIPAGMARMSYLSFVLYTLLGSFLWSSVLACLGYYFGANQELIENYYHQIGIGLGLVFAVFIIYLVIRNRKRRKLQV